MKGLFQCPPFYYNQGFVPLSKEDEGADTRQLYFDLKQL